MLWYHILQLVIRGTIKPMCCTEVYLAYSPQQSLILQSFVIFAEKTQKQSILNSLSLFLCRLSVCVSVWPPPARKVLASKTRWRTRFLKRACWVSFVKNIKPAWRKTVVIASHNWMLTVPSPCLPMGDIGMHMRSFTLGWISLWSLTHALGDRVGS